MSALPSNKIFSEMLLNKNRKYYIILDVTVNINV